MVIIRNGYRHKRVNVDAFADKRTGINMYV